MLRGQVALVTGASRGIGRGIALQLGEAGATVYVTGREPKKSGAQEANASTLEETAKQITERGGKGIAVYCDHSDADDIKRLFERIEREQNGQLDILVNNAYSAVNALSQAMGKPFWELDPLFWDEVNNVGLRNHYICTVYAARLMVPRKKGLIVIISSMGGLQYLFNVPYGIGKCACDRLAADTAQELYKHNVTSVSFWPGAVRTEFVQNSFATGKFEETAAKTPDIFGMTPDEARKLFEEGETPEFTGRAIVHLAADKNQMKKTGRILITADLAHEYGFTDIDGRRPPSVRSVKALLQLAKWDRTSWFIPSWLKLPGWLFNASASKF